VKGNNLFGIKSHGKKDGLMMETHEVVDGEPIKVRDSFRRYDSYDESIADYGSFLQQNKRYKPLLEAATLQEQVEALGKSGYATDPEYADKVMSIAKSKRLEAL
jgi:flagellum-specific peptidoglycan hydrolase FlgJ